METNTKRNIALSILASICVLTFSGCLDKQADSADANAKNETAAAPDTAPTTQHETKHAGQKAVAHAKPVQAQPAAPKIVCANCGEVISVKSIEKEGDGSGLGLVAGGVVGGVAGHQVGGGKGKDLATAAGAIGGAILGNKIEKVAKKTIVFDVTVKMENGEERVLHQDSDPHLAAGDKVKVENDHVVKM